MSTFRRALLLLVCVLTPSSAEADDSTRDAHGDFLPELARGRLGSMRFRHGSPVTEVAFTPDGKSVLTTSADSQTRVWDVATGRERYHFRNRGAVSPDGQLVATCGYDPTIRLWDAASGKVVRVLKADGFRVLAAAFSPDGKTIAGLLHEGYRGPSSLRLFNVADGKPLQDYQPPPPENGQDAVNLWFPFFLADGRIVASYDREEKHLYLWERDSGKPLAVRAELWGDSSRRALSPDGKLLAKIWTAIKDGKSVVDLRDMATGQSLREFERVTDRDIGAVSFSPDGKILAGYGTSTEDQAVVLWSVGDGKKLPAPVPPLKTEDSLPAPFVLFSPDSRMIAVLRSDGIHLVEVATGKRCHHWNDYSLKPHERERWPQCAAFSSDGLFLAVGDAHRLRVWSVADGQEVVPVTEGHTEPVLSVAVSLDDRKAASCDSAGKVCLWDLASGRELRTLPVPAPEKLPKEPRELGSLTFSPDGKNLAAASSDGIVILWDTASAKLLLHFQAHEAKACVVFAPDGKALITSGEDGKVLCWDTDTGKVVRRFQGAFLRDRVSGATAAPETAQRLSLSPDGRLLIVADASHGEEVRIWEVATGRLRKQIRDADPMFNHYAPDEPVQTGLSTGTRDRDPDASVILAPGNRLLARNKRSVVHLLDVASGKELRRFGGRVNVLAMQFSPDGATLAAARADGTVRLWAPATGTVRGDLLGHHGEKSYHHDATPGGVLCLAFTHDGKALITGGSDGTLLLWDVPRALASWQSRAEPPTPREITELWEQLAGVDGERADEALRGLETVPAQAVALVRQAVKPVAPVEAERLARLLVELEDERFEVRKRATKELEKFGELAEVALRKRLAENPSLEVRLRIEHLLQKRAEFVASAEQVRALRAVELLERIGTAEAGAVLQTLSKGAPEARLTAEAQNALRRLAKTMTPVR